MKDFDFRKFIKSNYSVDRKLSESNYFAFLDFNNLNTLKASNLHKHSFINLGSRSTGISNSLNFREQLEMSMNQQMTPARLSFLKDQTKKLEGTVLTIANFQNSNQGQKVAIIEMSSLYLHDSVVPKKNLENQFSNMQLYGENNVSKKALVNLESYLHSNLGLFATSNPKEAIEEDGEPSDRIFFYGPQGLIMLRMTSQVDDDQWVATTLQKDDASPLLSRVGSFQKDDSLWINNFNE